MKAFVVTVYTRRCEVSEDGLSSVGEGDWMVALHTYLARTNQIWNQFIQFWPKPVLIEAIE